MSYSKADLIALAKELQRDATSLKARLADLQRGLAQLPIEEEPPKLPCPHCDLDCRSLRRLREHLENVHAENDPRRATAAHGHSADRLAELFPDRPKPAA